MHESELAQAAADVEYFLEDKETPPNDRMQALERELVLVFDKIGV